VLGVSQCHGMHAEHKTATVTGVLIPPSRTSPVKRSATLFATSLSYEQLKQRLKTFLFGNCASLLFTVHKVAMHQ